MITALLIAVGVQWVLLLALALMNVALFRQVGILHGRLGPVGALTLPGGPKPGEAAPAFSLPSLNGGTVDIGRIATDGRSTLLFFLSPTCPVCKSLLPVVKSLARDLRLRVVLASDGDEPKQRRMIDQEQLGDFPFVLSADLGLGFAVSKLPYAILIGPDATVVAKGLVNSREHLESLFEAQRTGVASLQDYLAKRSVNVS